MYEVRVHYPAHAHIVLHCSTDWGGAIEPDRVERDGTERVFVLEPPSPPTPFYFKPVRVLDGRADWAVGTNYFAMAGGRTVYPHFDGGQKGRITDKLVVGGSRTVRVFLPPGYDENALKRYPVLFVLDGANVFFPEEAFSGTEWEIDETLDCLNAMNLVNKVIVVALYSEPDAREAEYTAPGYVAFGRELVDHVLPDVRHRWRTLPGPENTGVMGSSLGGVAALFLAWDHPEDFGMAGCLSSTFGYRDDLLSRVLCEPRRNARIYLDSGWPGDSHRETFEMFDALASRGFIQGRDVLYLAFPGALHHEKAWAQRVHLPIQFFFGRAFRRANGHVE
ncbi:MAG: alpha/beta hydrolase [Alphaproteobacteria bacterium]|nr:alpha/beta hydrolase [Alphaproteobacteria bacterium]